MKLHNYIIFAKPSNKLPPQNTICEIFVFMPTIAQYLFLKLKPMGTTQILRQLKALEFIFCPFD